MSYFRKALLALSIFGFLIVAMGAAGGLVWALVDTKNATRVLGSRFAILGICEMVVTLYALGRGITHLTRVDKESGSKQSYLSHSFRK